MTRYSILTGLKKKDKETRDNIKRILLQLEKDGRAIMPRGPVSRTLQWKFRKAKERKEIYFGWVNKPGNVKAKPGMTMAMINPDFKLKIKSYTSKRPFRSVVIEPIRRPRRQH